MAESCPSVYLWICLTGAATSEESKMRGWFYFRQGSLVRALKDGDPSFVQDAWSHFYFKANRTDFAQ
jgi:hypothetical protein